MSDPAVAAYEELAALSERELELIGEERLDELATVWSARAALIEALPATPPEQARAALERDTLMQKRVLIEIERSKDAVINALGEVRRAQRMANAYAPGGRRGPTFVANA